MKETLDDQSRAELVKYRISRAEETIQEAMLLTNEGYYNAAINRLYYACFYAVQALLVKNGISSASHAGVKTMLSLNFVSKGLLDVEYGKTFSRLFEIRHSGDYDDFAYCDQSMTDEYTPKAVDFINQIKELLYK